MMNSKMRIVVWGAALMACVGAGDALAQHDHGEHQKSDEKAAQAKVLCPVTDEPANLSVSVATDDGPVFFCCKGCVKKYKADTKKYAEKVTLQGKALADRPKIQVKCPVNERPVDSKLTLDHHGEKVHFCNEKCMAKFKESPDKFKASLANSYTYQTKCPVMGGTIDPKASSRLPTGETIYWCCMGCEKTLYEDPEKYAANLEKQGIMLNVDELKKALKGKEPG